MTFSFDDVLLVPKFSDIGSRKEIDISSQVGSHKFSLPIISSPMDTVTGTNMAKTIFNHGGLGVLHRYNTIHEQCKMATDAGSVTLAAAVGVSGDLMDRVAALWTVGVKIVCVDVAHGHHSNVEQAIKKIKDLYAEDMTIIAGNVATPEGFSDLQSWGADAIRVGIGGGSICSTRIQTGHGIPTFHSVYACSQVKGRASLIADGGIKATGDIVKSIAAGADFVMLGSMLAGTAESPGEVMNSTGGKRYKVYRGMASRAAQEEWRGEARSLEGISTTIPYKGSVENILTDLKQNIRSGFSYSGARNKEQFQKSPVFIRQTSSGASESGTHILSKNE
tara:strand:- start:1312 stop:2316 length:1005 start_codon:yes stop_codon:yes gene_type:complete